MSRIQGYPMSRTGLYLVKCACGQNTSRKYARTHDGKCKSCVEGTVRESHSDTPTRESRILEHGYQAYAREEGHYGD